jgi:hypothetical protein
LLSGYSTSDQQLAMSIAKACRKQVAFRFKLPYMSTALYGLHSSKEENNIIRLIEPGSGAKAATYEFSYPYCIFADIQTHYLKDTSRVCSSRERQSGTWITKVTAIQKAGLDYFNDEKRFCGKVLEVEGNAAIISSDSKVEYLAEDLDKELKIGDSVSFLTNEAHGAFDILVIND